MTERAKFFAGKLSDLDCERPILAGFRSMKRIQNRTVIVRFLIMTAIATLIGTASADDHLLWQGYGIFEFQQELSEGVQRNLSLMRAPAELRIDYRISDQEDMRSAVFIAGAGLFYRGFEDTGCAPDTLEYLGLEGEYLLFVLSQAVGDAPSSVTGRKAVKTRKTRKPVELRYLQAIATVRQSVKAKGYVDGNGERVDFDLMIKGKRAWGTWDSSEVDFVVADDENLSDWEHCWRGAHSYKDGRQSQFTPFLKETHALSTFGEVRRAVLEQSELGQKPTIADNAATEPMVCGDFDPIGLTEGDPIVRVDLMAGAKLRSDDIESCIVVIYGLQKKPGHDRGLLAYRPKSVAYSKEVPKKTRTAAEKALTKWLFRADDKHKVSEEAHYYSVFIF